MSARPILGRSVNDSKFDTVSPGVSELDRVKEQLVYLGFWLGIMVATEIALAGWLISTPIGVTATLWFVGAFGAVLLGAGIYLQHRQIERRISQIGRL